jgi:chromate transporter
MESAPQLLPLIAVPTFNLAKERKDIGWSNFWIPIAGTLAIWALGVSPIYIIIIAGLGGFLYGKFIKPTE